MSRRDITRPDAPPARSTENEVDSFLTKLARTPAPATRGEGGRLVFAMDATASREPSWDTACDIQAQMFEETATLGGLQVQLVFYRGFGECKASKWVSDSRALVDLMVRVRCLGGRTQIGRVLRHAIAETEKARVGALVFVGDACEENVDTLADLAGRLGLLAVPVFTFHEGGDPVAGRAFRQIAQLSGGAYCPFDSASARQLRDLLSAVAVYAAGGRRALDDYGRRKGDAVRQITHQLK